MVSCEDLFTDTGVVVGSQDGSQTLRGLKRAQLARSRSGGIFSNPFRSDRDKMDQLTEILNQYSLHGIPEQNSLLTFSDGFGNRRRPGEDREGDNCDGDPYYLEEHWTDLVADGDQLSKRLQNQQDAIWELVHTEVFYIKRLKVVTDLFLACLCNLQAECLLNDIDTEKMFSNMTQVYEANHHFWMKYLQPMLNASRETREPLNPLLMKEGFLKFDQLFYPYVKYCLDHSNCLHYVKEKHKESELFKTYVVWCETRKDCERLRLMDLLVKPMQRLTKYSLLLKAILRKTEVESELFALKRMNECVEQFVLGVDASLRHRHEEERLASIATRIESYDAIEINSDEVEKVVRDYCRLDFLTRPMPGCRSHQIRQLLLEGSGLKLKDSSTSSKLDVHCFLFTDILLICKSVGKKGGDKVRVIRQPYLVERLVTFEHKDGTGFIVVYLNEFRVASALFILYSPDTKTWLNHIKKAQEQYKEAKQNALVPPSLFRTATEDDDYDIPSRALLMASQGSPRSSRSSLAHSHSGSIDMSEPGSAMGSTHMIPPASTPNLLSQPHQQYPSRAKSFELGELRNPSISGHDWDAFGRSHSMETRAPIAVTVTSPRPERRAFLLRGAGGTLASPYSSTNTLNVPYPVAKHPSCTSTLPVVPPTIPVPTLPPPPSISSSYALGKQHSQPSKVPPKRPPSPILFSRSMSASKPPLLKSKNVTGLTIHSAPPSEGPSPVHSVDSEHGSEGTPQSAGSDEKEPFFPVQGMACEDEDGMKGRLHQKRTCRAERRYHTADAIENMKKEKDSSIHKRLSWNYGQQVQGNKGVPSHCERILCNKHLNKCLSSDSVYSSSGFSSTGSVAFSVGSSECEQCGLEVLGHIQEMESTEHLSVAGSGAHGEDFGGNTTEGGHISAPQLAGGENANCSRPSSSIKIDVSEVRDGISSVQITVSGSNGGKPSKSELKKMKEFLLTNLEASEV